MVNKLIITSTSNTQIKEIRKLRERKARSESGRFLLEGIRIVIEAIQAQDFVEQIIVSSELLENKKGIEAVEIARKQALPVLEVSKEVFESISGKEGPQGLAAVGRQHWTNIEEIDTPLSGIWIALYQVADPGNLGSILRTLDGMGGRGVFLLDHCTDPYDPSAIRASMGGIFSKKLVRTGSADFIGWVKKKNIHLVGTSDSAHVQFNKVHYPDDMILLMGSEREGLTKDLETVCETIVSIPMMGNVDSLNLAIASSIVLYEIALQEKEPVEKRTL